MKVYLRTSGNLAEQVNAYVAAFNAKVLKHYYVDARDKAVSPVSKLDTYNYAYLQFETGDKIMIAQHGSKMPATGYQLDIILGYANKAEFNKAFDRLSSDANFKMDYPITTYAFSSTITKFYDRWGYGWVLELAKDNKPA